MKLIRYISIPFLSIIFNHTSAQVSILEADMMKLGDTVRVSEATDAAIDYQTTGPNSTWDFSYLQADWQSLIDPFDPQAGGFLVNSFFGPGAGDYAADYYRSLELPLDQAGQFLPVNIEDAFRFTKITDDSVTYVGLAIDVDGNKIAIRSDTIEKVYEFPLNYEDAYSSRGYTSADFTPIFDGMFKQYRQRESEVDGYGSVTTVLGTYECIRIHHIIDELDSLYIGQGIDSWFPLELPRRHVYEWWAKDELYPVVRIEVQEINGDDVVTEIEYQDVYLGLDASLVELSPKDYKLFPNPTQRDVKIETNSKIAMIQVFDSKGKLVLEEEGQGLTNQSINLGGLERGLYLLNFVTDKGFAQHKILKF